MRLKSDAEILRYVKSFSSEKGVHLSPTMCAVFISLLRLFLSDAEYDKEQKIYYVQYSCREFANLLQFSCNMISSAMQKLDEAGLIKRIPVKKDFRRLKGGAVSVNKPNITYIDLSLFVKE